VLFDFTHSDWTRGRQLREAVVGEEPELIGRPAALLLGTVKGTLPLLLPPSVSPERNGLDAWDVLQFPDEFVFVPWFGDSRRPPEGHLRCRLRSTRGAGSSGDRQPQRRAARRDSFLKWYYSTTVTSL